MPIPQTWKNRTRIEFSPEACGVPDAVHFGRYNYVRAGPGLPVHTHDRAMEFCFLLRGRQTYRVGRRYHRLTGGDVFVTFPDEPHGTGDAPEEKGVLCWLIVKIPPRTGSFLGLPPNEGAALRSALIGLPLRRFRGSKQIQVHLDAITTHYLDRKSSLRGIAMHNHIVALLLEVVAAARRRGRTTRIPASGLDRITRRMEDDLSSPPTLVRLAGAAGLSLPRFKTWFKEQTGVPPGEYLLRLRVEEARRRLMNGAESVTTISYALGFSSSQYFATVVKRYTGLTPRQIRPAAPAN